jgi:hypothetical protein
MQYIACTRFTDETLDENMRYRETRGIPCIYGTPIPTNEKYSRESRFFIVEMNNTTNRIVGIGLVYNKPQKDRVYIIHDMAKSECNYNRYIFRGEQWLKRDDLPEDLVEMFDKILFKGKSHLKRIRGISVVTNKLFTRWEYKEAEVVAKVAALFN